MSDRFTLHVSFFAIALEHIPGGRDGATICICDRCVTRKLDYIVDHAIGYAAFNDVVEKRTLASGYIEHGIGSLDAARAPRVLLTSLLNFMRGTVGARDVLYRVTLVCDADDTTSEDWVAFNGRAISGFSSTLRTAEAVEICPDHMASLAARVARIGTADPNAN